MPRFTFCWQGVCAAGHSNLQTRCIEVDLRNTLWNVRSILLDAYCDSTGIAKVSGAESLRTHIFLLVAMLENMASRGDTRVLSRHIHDYAEELTVFCCLLLGIRECYRSISTIQERNFQYLVFYYPSRIGKRDDCMDRHLPGRLCKNPNANAAHSE